MSGIVSPFAQNPNALLSMADIYKAADTHQNTLLQQQASQQAIGANEIEYLARASSGLLELPDEQARAAAYPGAVAQLQQYGLAKNAPSAYPGEAALRRIASMGTSSADLYKLGANARAKASMLPDDAAAPGTGGATTAANPALAIPARGTGGPGAGATLPTEWLPHFQEASRETGIPVDLLIAQARQESSFNPNARGAAGEIGLFQIKPSTAQSPGFGMTGVDPGTLSDPRSNILFGARYLKARMGGGDPNNPADQARALAAYNGGGDPNYVTNVNRYRPGMSPTDPNAAVTTYTPGAPAGAPTAPAPYKLAGPMQPPPAASTTRATAPPARVETTDPETGLPVVSAPLAPQNPLAPPPQPPAAATQPQAPAIPRPQPPEPLTGGFTAAQRARLREAQRDPNVTSEEFGKLKDTYVQANAARQDKYQTELRTWQRDEEVRQKEAAAAARADQELALKVIDADKGKSDADRIKQTLLTIGPKIKAGSATPEDIARYTYDWNEYAYGDVQEIPNPDGTGTVKARVPREVRQDLFPPPPGQNGPLKPQVVPGTQKQPEAAPTQVVGGILTNADGQAKAMKALADLEAYPGGVGAVALQPNFLAQLTDPQGVAVRASIADVQAHEFHTLTGASQTASEAGRLKPFVVDPTDTAEAIKTKLRRSLDLIRETNLRAYRAYGPEVGGRRYPVVEEAIIASIPATAINRLRENPKETAQFDKIFGKGSAKLVLDNG